MKVTRLTSCQQGCTSSANGIVMGRCHANLAADMVLLPEHSACSILLGPCLYLRHPCSTAIFLDSPPAPSPEQDLVEVLSTPGIWKTPLKNDQASYQRNADGSLKVSLHNCVGWTVQHGGQCRCSVYQLSQGTPA